MNIYLSILFFVAGIGLFERIYRHVRDGNKRLIIIYAAAIICLWSLGGFFLIPRGEKVKTEETAKPTSAVLESKGLSGCKQNLRSLGEAAEAYARDHNGRYPVSLTQLLPVKLREIEEKGNETYLKLNISDNLPVCPSNKKEYNYKVSDDGSMVITCQGSHNAENVAAGYPQYSSKEGLIVKGK